MTDPDRLAQLEQEVADYSAALVLEEKRANTLHAQLAVVVRALEEIGGYTTAQILAGKAVIGGDILPHVNKTLTTLPAAARALLDELFDLREIAKAFEQYGWTDTGHYVLGNGEDYPCNQGKPKELLDERTALREALQRYGHHAHDCNEPNVFSKGKPCQCGFNAALTAALLDELEMLRAEREYDEKAAHVSLIEGQKAAITKLEDELAQIVEGLPKYESVRTWAGFTNDVKVYGLLLNGKEATIEQYRELADALARLLAWRATESAGSAGRPRPGSLNPPS